MTAHEQTSTEQDSKKSSTPSKALLSVLDDDAIKKVIATRTVFFILFYIAITSIEFFIDLPFISLSHTPVISSIATYIYHSLESWRDRKIPSKYYFVCSDPNCNQLPIQVTKESAASLNSLQSCSCGAPLHKKCRQNKHFIVSPDYGSISNGEEEAPPTCHSICQFCDSNLPLKERRHI